MVMALDTKISLVLCLVVHCKNMIPTVPESDRLQAFNVVQSEQLTSRFVEPARSTCRNSCFNISAISWIIRCKYSLSLEAPAAFFTLYGTFEISVINDFKIATLFFVCNACNQEGSSDCPFELSPSGLSKKGIGEGGAEGLRIGMMVVGDGGADGRLGVGGGGGGDKIFEDGFSILS